MSVIDEIIQDAMRKGYFDALPGAGKPLKLEDDSLVPETQRMANKLLRDNKLVPDWMAQGQELDAAREKLILILRRAEREYRGALNDALRAPNPVQTRQRVEARWQTMLATLREQVTQHNRQVLSYNLKVPKGVAHKRHFDFEAELNRLRSS